MKKQLYNNLTYISLAGHFICFVAVLSFLSLRSSCQTVPQEIIKYDRDKFSEELYVQTDRDLYISGETVQIKIFCLNRLTNKPSHISKVIYVSLLDNLNNPVTQVKLGVNGFSASGQIDLPETIASGNYYLSSCTHWMQNFSPNLFSYKTISVINPFENLEKASIPIRSSYPDTVIFFPEGGRIISGTENKVGFMCLDKNGYPVRIKGRITDAEKTLFEVESDDSGYGLFSLTPQSNNPLYLVPEADMSPGRRFSLPPASESAISFSFLKHKDDDLLSFRILKGPGFVSSGRRFYLISDPVATSPFIREVDPDMETELIVIKNSLPAGLSTLMMTDDREQILAKRLIYNKPLAAHISVKAEKSEYLTREKVRLNIYITDPDGNPAESDIIASVVKSFTEERPQNNLSSFVQLPGYVAMNCRSEYADINDQLIFYKDEDGIIKSNDTFPEEPRYLPEIEGHIIRGNIKSTVTGEPLQNENIVFAFVGSPALCRFTRTDNNGYFQFIVSESGRHEIVIQPLRPDLSDYFIDLINPFPELLNEYKAAPLFIDTTRLEGINNAIIAMQVQALYEPLQPRPASFQRTTGATAFYGEPDEEIRLSTYIDLTSLKEVIKELVPDLTTFSRKDKNYFNLIYRTPEQSVSANPFVMVDGVPVHDHDAVLKIKPDEIEMIKVLYSRYFIKDMVLEGIVDFTTKEGRLGVPEFDRPVFRQEFESLQTADIFHSPDYSTVSQKESRIPDFRNTLYWNPWIRTDNNGTATVEFFTSDEPGTYNIIVEGFTYGGHKGSARAVISVK
ncbi:MAG: hypothetical protein MUC78_04305 [Bacteroidales bacterium]|jgi:hypothetical protein|nr:hypothetical protein [Bacteroidales bacterium]